MTFWLVTEDEVYSIESSSPVNIITVDHIAADLANNRWLVIGVGRDQSHVRQVNSL